MYDTCKAIVLDGQRCFDHPFKEEGEGEGEEKCPIIACQLLVRRCDPFKLMGLHQLRLKGVRRKKVYGEYTTTR